MKILAIEILRVHLEHFDDQRIDIFYIEIERDRVVRGEFGLVREREIEVDAVLELLIHLGRQHRIQLLGISQAIDDLRLGEQVLEILVVDVGEISFVIVGIDEKVLQVAADQRLVVADDREHRGSRKIGLQIGGELPPLDRFHVLRLNIDDVLGQFDVLQESSRIVFSLASGRAPADDKGCAP